MDFKLKAFGTAYYAFPVSQKAKEDCRANRCKSYWSPTLEQLKRDLKHFSLEVTI